MTARLPLRQQVLIRTLGPMNGTTGFITEYAGTKHDQSGYLLPQTYLMYRVAVIGQKTPLTFAENELIAI